MKNIYFDINGMELRIIHGAKDVNLPKLINIIKNEYFNGYKREPELRLALQNVMDVVNCPVTILLNGNTVWSYNKTMRDFKRVIKANDTSKMSNHLYSFFHLCCGTIAHYDKYGWASTYSDNRALRTLFKRNEYGQSVVNGMPGWETDAIRIARDMEEILERGE